MLDPTIVLSRIQQHLGGGGEGDVWPSSDGCPRGLTVRAAGSLCSSGASEASSDGRPVKCIAGRDGGRRKGRG